MPAPNPIRTIGTILAPASARTYRTVLANGKEIPAHLSPRPRSARTPDPGEPRNDLPRFLHRPNRGDRPAFWSVSLT